MAHVRSIRTVGRSTFELSENAGGRHDDKESLFLETNRRFLFSHQVYSRYCAICQLPSFFNNMQLIKHPNKKQRLAVLCRLSVTPVFRNKSALVAELRRRAAHHNLLRCHYSIQLIFILAQPRYKGSRDMSHLLLWNNFC